MAELQKQICLTQFTFLKIKLSIYDKRSKNLYNIELFLEGKYPFLLLLH